MNIDRVHQLINSNTARVTPVEKVQPSQPIEDTLKKPEQNQGEKQSGVDKKKMEEVVKGLNDFIQPVSTSIQFVLHEKLNDFYVTIINDQTKEVIREIPSKKVLDTYANMMESIGLLVDKKI